MLALVVDDEELVRAVAANILKRSGWRVLLAHNVADARRIYARTELRRRLDLVVTDIQMPGASGFDLGRELAVLCPGIPVLFMSGGYRDHDPEILVHLRPGRVFLEKPFSERSFLTRLAEVRRAEQDGELAVPASGQ